ncbi:MAG: YfhO family protein [Solirubrobacterales bacterium]|nr:YfhO family protein [Solirubrobacterales bacterium]
MEPVQVPRWGRVSARWRSLTAWSDRRPFLSAALVFAFILLVFFNSVLFGKQMSQQHILWAEWPWHGFEPATLSQPILANEGDEAHTFYPLRLAAGRDIRAGEIPLWNRYTYGGHVMLGDQQTALLYPLTWIGILLPLAWAWGPMCLLNLLIAAMGIFAFARGVGIKRSGGLVAGTVFMLSAPMLGWLQWPHSLVFALFGWLLWATDRLTKSGRWRDVGWVSVVIGLEILAGHPESAILNSLAAFTYATVVILADRERRATWLVGIRKLGMWALSNALGLAAAGAAVIPFYTSYDLSIERISHKYQSRSPLDLSDALLYLMPDLYGRADSWPNVSRLDFLFTSTLVDFGVGALILALIALWRFRAAAQAKALAAVAGMSALLMFGVWPAQLLLKIPPLNTVIVQRVYVYIAAAGAIGAGAAVASLIRRPLAIRSVLRWTALPLVIGVAVLELELAFKTTYGPERTVHYSAVGRLAAILILTAIVLWMLGRVKERWAVAAALVLCVSQVAYLTNMNVWLSPSLAHPATPPSIQYLQKQPGTFRIGTIRIGVESTLMQSNASAMYGLESLEGHDPPISRRWVSFATKALAQPGYLERLPGGPDPRDPKALELLRMMNVRYYLSRPYARYSIPGLKEVYRGPDAVIYRDAYAMPRSFIVPKVRRTGALFTLTQMKNGKLKPRQFAYVPVGSPGILGGGDAYRSAVSKWTSNREMRVDVPTGPGGWLVVGNPWTPDWKATVDGKEAVVVPTNFAIQGISIPPGKHTVVFTYSSTPFWQGVLLSLFTFSLLALFIIGGRRGWRPRRAIEQRLGRDLPIPAWAVGPGEAPLMKPEPNRVQVAVARAKNNLLARLRPKLSQLKQHLPKLENPFSKK